MQVLIPHLLVSDCFSEMAENENPNKIFQNANKLKTFTETLHLRVFYMFVYNKNKCFERVYSSF